LSLLVSARDREGASKLVDGVGIAPLLYQPLSFNKEPSGLGLTLGPFHLRQESVGRSQGSYGEKDQDKSPQ
jgi:hypothetical protein